MGQRPRIEVNRFLSSFAVYEEMKYFFVLIITLTIHVKKKKRSLGPGKSETLLTRVKSPFYRQYRAKGHVTESLSRILNWLRQINLTEKFGTLQNTKFSFLLKKKVYKIRLSVKHQHSFFENCFRLSTFARWHNASFTCSLQILREKIIKSKKRLSGNFRYKFGY